MKHTFFKFLPELHAKIQIMFGTETSNLLNERGGFSETKKVYAEWLFSFSIISIISFRLLKLIETLLMF